MRWLSLVSVICAALGSHAPAQSPPTVDDLVARHIAARGGYDRLKSIQTIRITRTIATPFSDIRVILYRKRPHFYRVEQGPVGQSGPLTPRGINAQDVWDTVQGGRIVTRSESAAAEARELEGDFDGLLVDWKAKGHIVTYEGNERLPSGEIYKLKVRTKSGAERTIYLDASTYLERRQTGTLNLAGGRQFNVVQDFGNYKEIEGVKIPFDITEERTGKEPVQSMVGYTEKVELNVPLDDSLFATPAPSASPPKF
jgi:hypothetical protein